MTGQVLGHYRVLEQIGAGGMGVVYRAHDDGLDRDVAIKILPAGVLTDESTRRRFRKEALTLAKLNHPNVENVYEFASQDGVDFLVLEYIPGVTLSDKLASRPLPETEVLRLGAQLAEGLAAAHERHIVHRDLKPGNLRVMPDGRLRILDFGLAEFLQSHDGSDFTTNLADSTMVAGTLPYMAPEQLRGAVVDARTDIYAAGVVLYEMATGRRPFANPLPTALADDIQHTQAAPPSRLKVDLSARLDDIVMKCLEKAPELRYQSAKELLVDLRRLSAPESMRLATAPPPRRPRTGILIGAIVVMVAAAAGYLAWQRFHSPAPPASDKIMLAVLPVDNLSGNPDQEYFSDGLTEEMIAQLGALQPQRLGVIARTSAMRYKHTTKAIDEIGRELGVNYVLESSVRRDADRVRISAELIQVRDQTHLWAEIYERQAADIFAVQSEVAQRVANSLELELLPAKKELLARGSTASEDAHEAYLKGRFYWYQRGEANLNKSLTFFEQAAQADSTYALAFGGIADAYVTLGNNLYRPPADAYPKAKQAAKHALELDSTLADAHTVLCMIGRDFDWDWSEAEAECRRAIGLNAGSASAHQRFAFLLFSIGRYAESIAEIEQARALDPVSPTIARNVGQVYYLARQYDRALAALQQSREMYPNDAWIHEYLGSIYAMTGLPDRAVEELQKSVSLDDSVENEARLATVLGRAGKKEQARAILAKLEHETGQRYVSDATIALASIGIADTAHALDALERGFHARDPRMTILATEPLYDPLRSEPRFQDLLRRMNLTR